MLQLEVKIYRLFNGKWSQNVRICGLFSVAGNPQFNRFIVLGRTSEPTSSQN